VFDGFWTDYFEGLQKAAVYPLLKKMCPTITATVVLRRVSIFLNPQSVFSGKGKCVPVQSTIACQGSTAAVPLILKLGVRQGGAVNCRIDALCCLHSLGSHFKG